MPRVANAGCCDVMVDCGRRCVRVGLCVLGELEQPPLLCEGLELRGGHVGDRPVNGKLDEEERVLEDYRARGCAGFVFLVPPERQGEVLEVLDEIAALSERLDG